MTENAEVLATVTNRPMKEIISETARDTEWSSDVEIISMCSLLRCDIYTYLKKSWVRYQPKIDCGKRKGSLYLSNKKEVHYEPVISIQRATRGTKRKSPEYDGNNDKDDNDEMPSRQMYSRNCKTGKTYTENKEEDIGKKEETKKTKKQNRDLSEEVDLVRADVYPVYILSSVVCHQGLSLNSGHYVAYTRNASTNEWLYCSDECVYSVPEEKALNECAEKGYVFYYSKYSS
ncbi:unnamed protein product [Caenorhabditis angaria]|uniref:USP domain-containing protein n=1 Tax=Caenorhabditis angaria TaxID=860376 RepID=A0A9P1MSI7_9PELO|nr:unnamed protein product [Caenorhabditis angaria]